MSNSTLLLVGMDKKLRDSGFVKAALMRAHENNWLTLVPDWDCAVTRIAKQMLAQNSFNISLVSFDCWIGDTLCWVDKLMIIAIKPRKELDALWNMACTVLGVESWYVSLAERKPAITYRAPQKRKFDQMSMF